MCRSEGERDLRFPVADAADTTIGRDDGNLVQLTASEVSKKHAVIRWREGEWWIEDCGSKNGVFVDGVKVDRHTLHHGDAIGIGPYQIQFQTDVKSVGWTPDHVIDLSTQAAEQTMANLPESDDGA